MGVRLIAATLLVLAAAGCASIPPDAGRNPADPLEVYNRHIFEFNERLDRYVVKPIAEGYVAVVPEPVRDCIRNVFRNLGDVGNAVNNLLQGKFFEASADLCRVAINSTVGLLGCFDIASRMGLARSNEDFGQTLGRWGIGPGPYFVLPLLGPSTIRDTFGRVADAFGDPLTYLDSARVAMGAQTLRVIDTRAGLLEASRLLEGAALDRYQFVRDAYLQRRRNLIYDGDPPRERAPEQEPAREGGAVDRPGR
ncbi:MAG: VacJ family lipoprotein [Burkholderiaceae bacterium]|nr:VacJ family lipoprotein [Burkholderiaceae bacterium]